MKIEATLAVTAATLVLSACQTTGTGVRYVKQAPGPAVETAIAQCKAYAAKASHVVIGIGGPEVIVAGLIGTAIATGVRRAYVFEQCMTAQGYRKADANAPASPQPTAAPARTPKAVDKPSARPA